MREHDSFDDMLDLEIRSRSSDVPRAGLPGRVLAHIDANRAVAKQRWKLWGSLATAAGIIGAALLFLPFHQRDPVVPQLSNLRPLGVRSGKSLQELPPLRPPTGGNRPSTPRTIVLAKAMNKPTTGQDQRQPAANITENPKLDNFPSHTADAAVAFGSGPADPLPQPTMQGAEQLAQLRAQQATPITIASLNIAPIQF